MKISIIHPSRSRPLIAKATCAKWLSRADGQIEYIMSLDLDDPTRKQYKAPKIISNSNKNAIQAINYAAAYATGDLLIVVSDDFDCEHHWDTKLLKYLEGKSDFIVKTPDGLQPWIITLPILDRKYYERFGEIYPNHIKHMFADTWMTHVADLTGRKITVPVVFRHQHYTTGRSAKDALNERNNTTWADGEAKYLEGVRTNFGLAAEQIKGKLLCPQSFKDWLAKKL